MDEDKRFVMIILLINLLIGMSYAIYDNVQTANNSALETLQNEQAYYSKSSGSVAGTSELQHDYTGNEPSLQLGLQEERSYGNLFTGSGLLFKTLIYSFQPFKNPEIPEKGIEAFIMMALAFFRTAMLILAMMTVIRIIKGK